MQAVLEQTWRVEEDGTYIVLMQSTDHAMAPQYPGSWLNWFQPVRAEVSSRHGPSLDAPGKACIPLH